MKKFLALTLVILMILGTLASCGKRGDYVPNESGTDEVTDEVLTPDVDGDGNGDEQTNGDENADNGNADGGNTDGGNTDGGNTDGGNTDGGNTDGGNTDGGNTNGGNTDNGNTNNGGSTEPTACTHTGGTATCTKKAVCTTCNQEYGELAAHTGGTATCAAKAICTVCSQPYGELSTIHGDDKSGATCKTQAICSICDAPNGGLDANSHEDEEEWVSDANGHKTVYKCCNAAGRTCPTVTSHNYGSNDACTVCGYVNTNARHAHNYVNKQCSLCGLKLENATVSVGDVIYFGTYPQSAASGSFTAGEWIQDNGVYYTDIESGGNKYRGVKTSANGAVSWFKYDPIAWEVLAIDGNKALILSELVIDAQAYQENVNYAVGDNVYHKEYSYNEDGTYANNYKDSTIREWLITTFYNNAFSNLQKEVIAMTTVDNDDNVIGDYSNGNKFFCEDTEDKIFLLSKGEVKIEDYGFTYTKNETSNETKQKGTSDYSYKVITANGYEPTNGAWWWLRTPAYSATREYNDNGTKVTIDSTNKSDLAHNIKVVGTIWSTVVNTTSGGVVPAMWIYI